jgi:hypothetical protein
MDLAEVRRDISQEIMNSGGFFSEALNRRAMRSGKNLGILLISCLSCRQLFS